jgi:hypothetical protein
MSAAGFDGASGGLSAHIGCGSDSAANASTIATKPRNDIDQRLPIADWMMLFDAGAGDSRRARALNGGGSLTLSV